MSRFVCWSNTPKWLRSHAVNIHMFTCVCVWKAMYIYNYTYMYIYIYSPWILIIQWKKTWNIMIGSDHQNLWLTHKPTTFPAYRDFDFATSHPNWSIARWIRVIATLPKEKGDGDESTRFFFSAGLVGGTLRYTQRSRWSMSRNGEKMRILT